MGTADVEQDSLNSYAAAANGRWLRTQQAHSSLSRPHKHFNSLSSAFDGDDHDCSGTLTNSTLQEAHEHLPAASSLVELRWQTAHGKQQIPPDRSNGAVPAGAMHATAPSTLECIDGGSQWSARSGSGQSLDSMVRLEII